MVDNIQQQIDSTDYWDAKVLDFNCSFFGDEVYLYVENDENTSWKFSFLVCHSVNYETDASWNNWRTTLKYVKDMKGPQLGYYCQDISVSENKEFEGFYDISFNISIMTGKIICKEIKIEKISNDKLSFFWK
ncbi:hypothetical protein BCR32DRAFT_297833 [Anaeromyces robustus]|uniref:Uncharacterized protein n=1 Tax=Anaeromyces robustus TaxID=1754192 RepID=A0A1Y1VUV1_9FUNG|nr:hypothetical protein BCR32DRAFT_297833 [Anaeromyces robustus]|eukprot:ORX65057.1 hypothetical protein BCR32DRAFT_297833 [Anaeromyces robustus]